MSQTLRAIQHLIDQGDVRISAHGYDELAADAISTRAVIGGVGMRLSSKITRSMAKARRYWFYNTMGTATLSTS